MNNPKKIHNIVAPTSFDDAMRRIRFEFMLSIRGYMKGDDKDEQLIQKAEKEARLAIENVLLEEFDTPGKQAFALAKSVMVRTIDEAVPRRGLQLTLKDCTHESIADGFLYQEHIKRLYRDKDFKLPIAEYTDHLSENASVKNAPTSADEIGDLSLDEMKEILLTLDRGDYKIEKFKE